MKYKRLKGFTLVELLVVIAILAVLATVSVVGYTAFIHKANVANDKAMVAQINNLLLADEVADKRPSTVGGALRILADNGVEILDILPTAKGHEIVYDATANRFALLENGSVVFADKKLSSGINMWKFVDNPLMQDYVVPETSKNSLFLLNPANTVTLNFLVGIEGTIENLNIKNEDEASIVVAGDIGRLEIDAQNATVDHYGVIKALHVTRIGHDCYKEHGFLVELQHFGTGKFVACEGAQFAQSQTEIAEALGSEDTANVLAYENTAVQNNANVFDQKHNYSGESAHTCSYETISGSATCTESGTSVQKCVICGNEIANETQDALGHNYQTEITKTPTCTEKGTQTSTCTRCGDTFDQEVATSEHDYKEDVTTQPTCAEKGTKTYTCSSCGDTYTEEIAALGHKEVVDEGVAATCTAPGKTEGKHCSTCGTTIVAQQTVAALGHKEEAIPVQNATCTKTGLTAGAKCSVCGEILTAQEEISISEHADTDADGRCDWCGTTVEVWELVTSTDQLANYNKVIIAYNSDGACYAMSRYTEGTLTATKIAPQNGRLVNPDIAILHFEITQNIFWCLKSDNRYLNAVSESTLGFADDATPNYSAQWNIEITNGFAKITSCQPEYTLIYREQFCCTGDPSATGNIVLYKLVQPNSGN